MAQTTSATLSTLLNPTQTPDAARQAAVEKQVYNSAVPSAATRDAVLQWVNQEPVKWIRQMEIRLLKKCPFDAVALAPIAALLSSTHADVRQEVAGLLGQMVTVLTTEKRVDDRKVAEAHLLPVFSAVLKEKPDAVWMEVYKTLTRFSPTESLNQMLVDALNAGGEDALYIFAQYAQGRYPTEGLQALLSGALQVMKDDTRIHILRALGMTLPKEGPPRGYPDDAPVIQTLLSGMASVSENVRKEAAVALGSRARAAKKQKTTLTMEAEIWETLFRLYETRLSATTAPDRDHAKESLRAIPTTPERMLRLFELMHRVTDELQKQNVVDLVGTFKTAETKDALIKMLKVNFAGLRLEAQKTTIDAAAGFIPDPDVEAELEKLLEGKGLHADIQAKLADKLFADLASLKARLQRWLRVDAKSGRPVLERFELPMMHIKIIESAKKRPGDADIQKLLVTLGPLLMMNDANVKLHETLREFPGGASTEPLVLPMDQVVKVLLSIIDARSAGRIVFEGITLPAEFGGGNQLEFSPPGVKGLTVGAAQMAKDFVKKAVEDLFGGVVGDIAPAGTQFRLVEAEDGVTVSAV